LEDVKDLLDWNLIYEFRSPSLYKTAGYGNDFDIEEYNKIARFSRQSKGQVVISVNDIPEMRESFVGIIIKSVPITYTVGGASNLVKRSELIIRNK